jgi:hypothetical protein
MFLKFSGLSTFDLSNRENSNIAQEKEDIVEQIARHLFAN